VRLHLLEGHFFLTPPEADAVCDLRRQLQQTADRLARSRARAQLHHLSEQHEYGDGGRRLVVDRHGSAGPLQRGREKPRRQRCHDAVQVRRADAERNEREHVG